VPLNAYGVLIGTLASFTRDPQHNFGSWYHGHIAVNTPQGQWDSALDVDTTPQGLGIAFRMIGDLGRGDLGPVANMADGWHALPSDATSGAFDYVRSPALRDQSFIEWIRRQIDRWRLRQVPLGAWAEVNPQFGPAPFRPSLVDRLSGSFVFRFLHVFPWTSSNGDNALDALEPHVTASTRLYLFGQRFTTGNGVHDVHMNQGDPAGSQWYGANGTWQDGLVACEKSDGSVVTWQVKFNNQSLNTDTNGNPV
jgi:hypothetical protein